MDKLVYVAIFYLFLRFGMWIIELVINKIGEKIYGPY